jgi:hypothetical protein
MDENVGILFAMCSSDAYVGRQCREVEDIGIQRYQYRSDNYDTCNDQRYFAIPVAPIVEQFVEYE